MCPCSASTNPLTAERDDVMDLVRSSDRHPEVLLQYLSRHLAARAGGTAYLLAPSEAKNFFHPLP